MYGEIYVLIIKCRFLFLDAYLKELVEHCDQSIESNSTEGGLCLMLLLITLPSKREEQKKKRKEQKNTKMKRKKKCEKRMTIILLEAHKQRSCTHTQV